ncbi:MAG: hypothetical protein JOZ69_12735, partial [Myxococcales bacterium]|nr:hypothetical protein [Myxococcales bacterium]
MSQTPTISQPPEPLTSTSSRFPSPPPGSEAAAILETAARLRVELEASSDRARQARLWLEVANLEEHAGDEPGAARDYLAAYNADQTFREPLESLMRLLEKRRSLKNLGKLVDALVRAAASPDEQARALLLRGAHQADVAGDWAQALASAKEAAAVEGAPIAEQASAWLAVELAAAKANDPAARDEALAARVRFATEPTWRALLLTDRARLALAAGDAAGGAALLEQACAIESAATWAAANLLERTAAERAGAAGMDAARACAEAHADALDATAALLETGTRDPARADALGVPRWARTPARLVDAWLRAAEARRLLGQLERAGAVLDRALAYASGLEGQEARIAERAVVDARIRVAEQTGDTALAARLAAARVAETRDAPSEGDDADPQRAAALAMRVAEHAAVEGDAPRAFEALSRAVASDPSCLPARALQLDMLADGGDPAAFAAQLESFADHLATDEARGRAFLLSAFVWAVQARDVAGARAALSQAALCGVAPSTVARLGRVLASVAEDAAWYEESTKRLLAAGAEDAELASLYVELVRARHARGDGDGELRALRELAAAPAGGWLARALEGFLPGDRPTAGAGAGGSGRRRAAVEELAGLERDPELARGLSLVAALRALEGGDAEAARARLRELAERDPSDTLVAALLGDLLRTAGEHGAAGRVASSAAAAATDAELGAALRFEAAFELWRAGDRRSALAELEAAASAAPAAAGMVLGWAGRGAPSDAAPGADEAADASAASPAQGPGALAAQRKAIERAQAGAVAAPPVLALERFAVEVGGGDPDAAAAALATVEAVPGGDLGIAAALARLSWSRGSADHGAVDEAIARIAAHGMRAVRLAAAERTRIAREGGDPRAIADASRAWFEAGGGLPAALEWVAAATTAHDSDEDVRARLAIAASLDGEAREALVAGAAVAGRLVRPAGPAPFVDGASAAVRLANLELAPPGCDPRRRAKALSDLDGALGDDARADARALAGWSALAASDVAGARAAFEAATRARPDDLASWEGLRACAEAAGDAAARAAAAAEIGKRCRDPLRAAAFWEEAALLRIDLHDEGGADEALEESFARDPSRSVAFDKLFRRVRARKENDKLLALVARRLESADQPAEIQKLFWEQARVLREKGDQDGALKALEHVTLLDPDHVGALALLGEINIRRGRFEDAAQSLARLAMLDAAPARNRVTAGVAAVDLYENKLDRHDKALEVLLS